MSQTIFHERASQFRFYVAAVLPDGRVVVEIPGGKTTLDCDAIPFAAVGDVGTCYSVGTMPNGDSALSYETDLKPWGRECRALTNAVAATRRRCDERIMVSDWRGLAEEALRLANAAALLHAHFEKQP